jgi:hypothetical protein
MTNENHTILCKNCNQPFVGNFCNHCGQAANTHKLSLHFIWHELQHGLFHFDNGIFYTIKQLLIRPGHSIREFINGKRVRHFKPLSFVIVLATLYGLLYHYFIDLHSDIKAENPQDDVVGIFKNVTLWMMNHLAYASFILILGATISTYIVFRKQGYNWAEHFVLNTYVVGLILVTFIVLLPVLYILKLKGEGGLQDYVIFSQCLIFILLFWCYAQFFTSLSIIQKLARTVLSFIFMSFISGIIVFAVGWLYGLASK